MFVEIFPKNQSIDFDKITLNVKHNNRAFVIEKHQGVTDSFSYKLRIGLENSLLFENIFENL